MDTICNIEAKRADTKQTEQALKVTVGFQTKWRKYISKNKNKRTI